MSVTKCTCNSTVYTVHVNDIYAGVHVSNIIMLMILWKSFIVLYNTCLIRLPINK